jgi:hypothetical protein
LYQSNQRDAALRAIRKVRDQFPSDPDSLKLEQALTQEQGHTRPAAKGP